MVLIKKVAAQAYRTFSQRSTFSELAFQQNLNKLRDLVSHLTAHDLHFDESLISRKTPFNPASGEAPVTYVDIWEDDHFSMSIFVLKPGTRLPMHDHPGMHGLIRVIHGQVNVFSYSVVEEKSRFLSSDIVTRRISTGSRSRYAKVGWTCTAKLQSEAPLGDRVDVKSQPLLLTPTVGNIHEIRTIDEPAAFFDILAPPYDRHDVPGEHPCHYYEDITAASMTPANAHATSTSGSVRELVCIPPPEDCWTDYASYNGPQFDPYDSEITV